MTEFTRHDGYRGLFTRDQHPNALKNGTRVRKINSEPGDAHRDGSRGTILGSIGHDDIGIGYFVEWDNLPRTAVFTARARLQPLN